MRLNKAQTRVLVDRKYTFYNYLGYGLINLIPIGFLSIRYNLFNFEKTTTVTSWGIIAIIIIISSIWSKIKETIKDYNTYMGKLGERAKMPIIFTVISIVLIIAYVSIQLLLGVTISLAVGGYVAMIPFNAYDIQNEKAKRMTLLLQKNKEEIEVNELDELQTLKKQKRATNR